MPNQEFNQDSNQNSNQNRQPDLNHDESILPQENATTNLGQAIEEGNGLRPTIATAVAVGVIVGVALFVTTNLSLAIAGGVSIAVILLSFAYPYLALWSLVIYLPFSGTVTSWLGGGDAIFEFVKDGLAIPAMISIFWGLKKQGQPLIIPRALKKPLIIMLVLALITLFTVNLPLDFWGADAPEGNSFLMGILGLKILLGYLPLITCTYYMLRTKEDFWRFTRLHVILVIICCSLGLVQYTMLATGLCQGTDHLVGDALFRATVDAKCFVGGALFYSPSQNAIHLPGTFVSPWQWAWFLIANTFLMLASALADPSPKWRSISFLAIELVLASTIVSGQSIALLLIPIIVISGLTLTGLFSDPRKSILLLSWILLLTGIAFVLFPSLIQGRIDAAIDRWQASPPIGFVTEQLQVVSQDKTLFGHGLGRATNATRIFGETRLIEAYYPKLLYEIGILGVAAFLGLVTVITVATFRVWRSLNQKRLQCYAACFWIFILFVSYQSYYYPLDVAPIAIYYWMIVGATLRLPILEQNHTQQSTS
ncbi:MAG: O-antigen ligase like membrane protein [Phormidium sp. OSCR]|nr:MAG: O-antigen ligase like membrane protein [Phormidium sp. OSCR]